MPTNDTDRQALYRVVADELLDIAPDADLDSLAPGEDMREALDLDSLDFLNLIIAINKRLGIQIPEADYGRLGSLDALLDYLQQARS